MDEQLRRSVWTKLSALGFIYLIILGNIWFAFMVVGAVLPDWLRNSFYLGVLFVLGSGAGLFTKILTNWYLAAPLEETDEEMVKDEKDIR